MNYYERAKSFALENKPAIIVSILPVVIYHALATLEFILSVISSLIFAYSLILVCGLVAGFALGVLEYGKTIEYKRLNLTKQKRNKNRNVKETTLISADLRTS
jgi:hypothetical protein